MSVAVRRLGLHLRARRVPAALAGLVAVAVTAWLTRGWLMERPFLDQTQARIPVAALAPLLAAAVLAQTLAADDEVFERTTARPWVVWRSVHLVLLGAVGSALLAATATSGNQLFGAWTQVRGTVGMLGLAAVATAVIGARVAWLPLFAYLSTVYLSRPGDSAGLNAVLTWPLQPGHSTTATVTAFVLGGVGLVVHAFRGSRPTVTD